MTLFPRRFHFFWRNAYVRAPMILGNWFLRDSVRNVDHVLVYSLDGCSIFSSVQQQRQCYVRQLSRWERAPFWALMSAVSPQAYYCRYRSTFLLHFFIMGWMPCDKWSVLTTCQGKKITGDTLCFPVSTVIILIIDNLAFWILSHNTKNTEFTHLCSTDRRENKLQGLAKVLRFSTAVEYCCCCILGMRLSRHLSNTEFHILTQYFSYVYDTRRTLFCPEI